MSGRKLGGEIKLNRTKYKRNAVDYPLKKFSRLDRGLWAHFSIDTAK